MKWLHLLRVDTAFGQYWMYRMLAATLETAANSLAVCVRHWYVWLHFYVNMYVFIYAYYRLGGMFIAVHPHRDTFGFPFNVYLNQMASIQWRINVFVRMKEIRHKIMLQGKCHLLQPLCGSCYSVPVPVLCICHAYARSLEYIVDMLVLKR